MYVEFLGNQKNVKIDEQCHWKRSWIKVHPPCSPSSRPVAVSQEDSAGPRRALATDPKGPTPPLEDYPGMFFVIIMTQKTYNLIGFPV